MALQKLNFRVSADDKAHLRKRAEDLGQSMGITLSDMIENANENTIADAVRRRITSGGIPTLITVGSVLLVRPEALDRLKLLTTTTAISSDMMIRLILEASRP